MINPSDTPAPITVRQRAPLAPAIPGLNNAGAFTVMRRSKEKSSVIGRVVPSKAGTKGYAWNSATWVLLGDFANSSLALSAVTAAVDKH